MKKIALPISQFVGKEIRRNFSSGQPIQQRGDIDHLALFSRKTLSEYRSSPVLSLLRLMVGNASRGIDGSHRSRSGRNKETLADESSPPALSR